VSASPGREVAGAAGTAAAGTAADGTAAAAGTAADGRGPSDAPGDPLDRLASALRAHVDARRRAEGRLASFAFTERPRIAGPEPSHAAGTTADWDYFVGVALRVAGEPTTLRALQALRADARPLERLGGDLGSPTHDPLAIGDWIGGLASAGLVSRELESNRVSLTPLGEAIVDLVSEVTRRAGAMGR
jgi:hypothetical protein